MKFIKLIAIVALLTSCSSKPDINKVENILSEKILKESNGNITLLSVEKTNAQDNEIMGQKTYTIQYKAQVEVKNNCFMYIDKTGLGPFFPSFKTYISEPEFIPSLQMQIVTCTKGEKVDFSGKMLFYETENGWLQ